MTRPIATLPILATLLAAALSIADRPALAQANERDSAILQGQQRVEFRRNQSIDADRKVRETEARLAQAKNRLAAAEREIEDARIVLQRADEDLKFDRARSIEARQAYDDESQRFQALRRGQ